MRRVHGTKCTTNDKANSLSESETKRHAEHKPKQDTEHNSNRDTKHVTKRWAKLGAE